jgi:prevent-host-death family protein
MKPASVGAFYAKTHLSELLERVRQGDTFLITHRGTPIAELRPAPATVTPPVFGRSRGEIWMSDDFDAPLEVFKDYMP